MSKCKELLKLIDFRTLDKEIVAPCLLLENSYNMRIKQPQSYEEFSDECTSYYKHLYGNFSNLSNVDRMNNTMAESFARQMVQQAFNNQGGERAAFEKAKLQSFALVKHEMTKVFIKDMRQQQIGAALSRFGKYDLNEKAEILKEYLTIIGSPKLSNAEFWEKVANFERVFQIHAQMEEQKFYSNLF